MSAPNYKELTPIDSDIHFLFLMLEQIWKISHAQAADRDNERLQVLQKKYRRALVKVRDFLATAKEPDRVLAFLETVKKDVLFSVDEQAQVMILKKLDLDFTVMLKKLNTPEPAVQKAGSAASSPDKPKEGVTVPQPTVNTGKTLYTREELVRLVRNTGHIRNSAFRRKQAKMVLSNLIKVMREKNPQAPAQTLEGDVTKNPATKPKTKK